ncbi:hypothetical protein ACLQ2R_05130 [Streptosporangium sp. DT93]|uniref:hypothetical protein n=1 Tax=Streptosporangium sp. DT93 TaxID=3393428 RepID=UPI003CE7A6F2
MSMPFPKSYAEMTEHYVSGAQQDRFSDDTKVALAICAQANATLAVAAAIERLADVLAPSSLR